MSLTIRGWYEFSALESILSTLDFGCKWVPGMEMYEITMQISSEHLETLRCILKDLKKQKNNTFTPHNGNNVTAIFTAWSHFGQRLYRAGLYDFALMAFDNAIKIEAEDEAIWVHKGKALLRLGQYAKAFKAFQKVLDIDPDSADAYWQLKYLRRKLKRIDDKSIHKANQEG